jgi:hypothetical protein
MSLTPKKTTESSERRHAAGIAALRATGLNDVFVQLRGQLRSMGMTGWVQRAALGAYFTAASRFQTYPLHVQIQERTQGMANYIVQKLDKLWPPGTVIRMGLATEGKKPRSGEPLNGKVVFIPDWEADTENGPVRIEVRGNHLVRVIPRKGKDRVVEDFEEWNGRFACISVRMPQGWNRGSRWLTMVEPEEKRVEEPTAGNLDRNDIEKWHGVQKNGRAYRSYFQNGNKRVWSKYANAKTSHSYSFPQSCRRGGRCV